MWAASRIRAYWALCLAVFCFNVLAVSGFTWGKGGREKSLPAFGFRALVSKVRGKWQGRSDSEVCAATAKTSSRRNGDSQLPACIASMPSDYRGGSHPGPFGSLFTGSWDASPNGAMPQPQYATMASTAAAAVVTDGFELSTLTPSEETKWLNRGLVRLSGVFGWCRSPADVAALEELRAMLLPSLPYITEPERRRVMVALEVAYHAHGAQKRKSGEPFVMHPLAVTQILASLQMDANVLVAGLLHDTVEDTRLSFADIEAVFGRTVRRIVEGETKVSKLPCRPGAYNATLQLSTAAAEAAEAVAGPRNRAAAGGAAPALRPAESRQVENLRHMLIAMSEDWRVLVVKLADRLHNMRTIGAMAPHKQLRIARETMDVFVPLAHRLGLWGIKCELEDLCFAVLQPDEHERVRRLVAGRQALTQHTPRQLEETRRMLEEELRRAPVWAAAMLKAGGGGGGGGGGRPRLGTLRVELHPKPLYRIWRTMQRSGSNFYIQQDVASFRIVFSLESEDRLESAQSAGGRRGGGSAAEGGGPAASASVTSVPNGAEVRPGSYEAAMQEKRACYWLLEAVHALLPPTDPPRVKDYIAFPKSNGYSSLHSTVFLRGYPVEVQVRTEWMERVAEHGVAASWLGRDARGCPVGLPWLREAQQEADATSAEAGTACGDAYAASIRDSLQGAVGRRFVFTGQGTILNLAANATVRDAALELHDARKLRVVAAKVNSRLVGFNHRLKDGDVVTVVTAPYFGVDADGKSTKDADASAPGSAASIKANALGAVHVQLVGSSVWPWSLVGRSASDEPLPADQRERLAVLQQQRRRLLHRPDFGSSQGRPPSMRELLSRKRVGEAAHVPLERYGAGVRKAKEMDGDMAWYMLSELKHGRMAIAAVMTWANLELLTFANRGPAAVASTPTAAGVHGSAFLYLMTPSQLMSLIVTVGAFEFAGGVVKNMQNAMPQRRQQQQQQLQLQEAAEKREDGSSSSGSSSSGLSLPAAVVATAREKLGGEERSSGRLAMIAVASLAISSALSGEDALGHVLGLF